MKPFLRWFSLRQHLRLQDAVILPGVKVSPRGTIATDFTAGSDSGTYGQILASRALTDDERAQLLYEPECCMIVSV